MTQFINHYPWIIPLVLAWSLPWKAWALWRAAHREQKYWFIALLLVNTLGILEILYLFVFSKKSLPDHGQSTFA